MGGPLTGDDPTPSLPSRPSDARGPSAQVSIRPRSGAQEVGDGSNPSDTHRALPRELCDSRTTVGRTGVAVLVAGARPGPRAVGVRDPAPPEGPGSDSRRFADTLADARASGRVPREPVPPFAAHSLTDRRRPDPTPRDPRWPDPSLGVGGQDTRDLSGRLYPLGYRRGFKGWVAFYLVPFDT